MSVKDVSKLYITPCHRRRESDELDVFEAAGYFSAYNEATGSEHNNDNIKGATHNKQKPSSENQYYHKKMNWRSSGGGRMSLDVPFRSPIPQQQQQQQQDKQILKENSTNKYKQPSSPGGRLTSFLNSLFNQAGSKKNKKKTKSTNDVVIDEESPGGWRRRRRSSISHFRSSNNTNNNNNTNASDSKSLSNFSSGNSGFRTPPPYAPTPTKISYKEFRSFSDHHHHHLKQVTGNYNSLASKQPPLTDHHAKVKPLDGAKSVENCYKENDDGCESDSSSDLFELQNYDLGLDVYSSGLPVYETTHMDTIKRGPPLIS